MSAYEGSKMQEADEARALLIKMGVNPNKLDSKESSYAEAAAEFLKEKPVKVKYELPDHGDIPLDVMKEIISISNVWSEEIQPWIFKGLVKGYLLALKKQK